MKRGLGIVGALAMGTMFIGGCGDTATETESGQATEAVQVEVDPMKNKGIGPISSVSLDEINDEMAVEGEKIFQEKCTACHKIDKRYIGPALKGVTERRTPEWIMNMILNPEGMVAKDPIARKLLMEFSAPMANQSLTEEQARKILEYFRKI